MSNLRPTLERIAHVDSDPLGDSLAPTLPGSFESGVTTSRRPDEPLPPEAIGSLGPYRVDKWLGAGAMADVYLAYHRVLEHKVAIKVLRPELASSDAFLKRFVTEGKALTLVRHQNVVQVIDIGRREDGLTWLAMEFLEGNDLEELCNARRPTPGQAIHIVRELTEAVTAVHEAGVVHRDIKPSNVFLARDKDHCTIKLVDFGIAKLPEEGSLDERELRGSVIGSPPYLAPEQAQGADTDHRCDIYAVGALLFELLTGRTPFRGDTVEQMLAAAIVAPPPAPSQFVNLPRGGRHALDQLVVSCLAKDPNHRPTSANEVGTHLSWIAAALEAQGDDAGSVPAPPPQLAGLRRLNAGDSPTLWADLWPSDEPTSRCNGLRP